MLLDCHFRLFPTIRRTRKRSYSVHTSRSTCFNPVTLPQLSPAHGSVSRMKTTGKASLSPWFSARNPPDTDLKAPIRRRRRNRNPRSARLKRFGAPGGRRSRPETPLLKWKNDEGERDKETIGVSVEVENEGAGSVQRRVTAPTLSARKLAAGVWKMQLAETLRPDIRGDQRIGMRPSVQPGETRMAIPSLQSFREKVCAVEADDPSESPRSVSGPMNAFMCKVENPVPFSDWQMEGATKWDPVIETLTNDAHSLYGNKKRIDHRISAVSVVSKLETKLEQARGRIEELEAERRSSKKKLEQFLRKVSEERAEWRAREHEKVRAFIDDVKADLGREKKGRQRLEIVNSKLVNELADAKLVAKRYMLEYEKERKARKLIEEVCDELANEIGEDKAQIEAMRRESMKFQEEVEEERKMLQMAEVWREERVQMKLIDAKVALEEKYSMMNKLVADLETFLRLRNSCQNVREVEEVELLKHTAASVNIQDTKEFVYVPPSSDDIYSVFEDVNFGETNERVIGPCVVHSPVSHSSKIHTVSPEFNMIDNGDSKRRSNDDFEDESGWETVSHHEDQGSNFSPEKRAVVSNRTPHQYDNGSGSGTEMEENASSGTPIMEISEVCAVPSKQQKKVSSISKLWKSCPNGENYKIISVEDRNGRFSNARKSNGEIMSPDRGFGKGGFGPGDLIKQWDSPDSGHPHVIRGMKGCIEWPRSMQKNGLKSKLMEARIESQKVQIRHVLKQKI